MNKYYYITCIFVLSFEVNFVLTQFWAKSFWFVFYMYVAFTMLSYFFDFFSLNMLWGKAMLSFFSLNMPWGKPCSKYRHTWIASQRYIIPTHPPTHPILNFIRNYVDSFLGTYISFKDILKQDRKKLKFCKWTLIMINITLS